MADRVTELLAPLAGRFHDLAGRLLAALARPAGAPAPSADSVAGPTPPGAGDAPATAPASGLTLESLARSVGGPAPAAPPPPAGSLARAPAPAPAAPPPWFPAGAVAPASWLTPAPPPAFPAGLAPLAPPPPAASATSPLPAPPRESPRPEGVTPPGAPAPWFPAGATAGQPWLTPAPPPAFPLTPPSPPAGGAAPPAPAPWPGGAVAPGGPARADTFARPPAAWEPPFSFGAPGGVPGGAPAGAPSPGDPTDAPGGALALLERIAEAVDRLVALTEGGAAGGRPAGPDDFERPGVEGSRWFDLFGGPSGASHSFDLGDAWRPGKGRRGGEVPAE